MGNTIEVVNSRLPPCGGRFAGGRDGVGPKGPGVHLSLVATHFAQKRGNTIEKVTVQKSPLERGKGRMKTRSVIQPGEGCVREG
jgi:hypothetical protein